MEPTQLSDFPPAPPAPPAYSQSGRKDGYTTLPQHDYGPPTGYSAPGPTAPPPVGYAPAPPVFQQQSSNTNVVVVGNQPTPAPSVVHVRAPRANDYMAFTAILMVLCFLHGNLPALIICLVPALICSCVAQDHNNAGEYDNAKSCGQAALCCNIFSLVYFFIALLAGVAVVIVYFTVGFEFLKNEANKIIPTTSPVHVCCYYDYYGNCRSYCSP